MRCTVVCKLDVIPLQSDFSLPDRQFAVALDDEPDVREEGVRARELRRGKTHRIGAGILAGSRSGSGKGNVRIHIQLRVIRSEGVTRNGMRLAVVDLRLRIAVYIYDNHVARGDRQRTGFIGNGVVALLCVAGRRDDVSARFFTGSPS